MEEFQTSFTLSYKLLIFTKYRAFQYKFLHRCTTTNILLNKVDSNISDLCSFCQQARETITHLFWMCPYVQQFWSDVNDWFCNRYKKNTVISLKSIIFCHALDIANLTVILAKYYIYLKRSRDRKLRLFEFIKFWNEVKNLEYHIASKNNRVHQCEDKWGNP